MNKFVAHFALLLAIFMAGVAHANYPVYADGDLAPLGAPDGLINTADYLIASQIALDLIDPTWLEYSHGDIYPAGAPDGVINIQDMLLLLKQVLAPSANHYVENLDLFDDGPATVYLDVGDTSSSTTLVAGGWKASGATVTNDSNYDDDGNTVWRFAVSGGAANVFLGTADLSSDPVLDSGFDLSGDGLGQLVFDIKVISLVNNPTLTVKIDSGYPDLGQVVLSPSQYTPGSWRRVAINFDDLVDQGAGLDLGNVVNAFVIEVTGGDAEFYLDNIFISHACPEIDGCHASVKTKSVYTLVWSDEFDGSELDLSNWVYETGYGGWGWGNGEWQLYTDSTNNVSVGGGNLEISARCASPPACGERDGTITSGRINTLNKFSFKYGKIEARIKPPVGIGSWPAFWMLGSNHPAVGWPQSGEIDVVEMHHSHGSNEKTTHFTLHWCDDGVSSNPCLFDPGWKYESQEEVLPYSLGDDFHVFSAEWDANGITGNIDDIPYYYKAINPATMDEFLKEFFMILNVAIGGTLGGTPDTSMPWPQTMLVDYVRVYQVDGGDGTYTIGPPPPSPELGIYSESHTDSVLGYSNIINGADFGGNVTNTNENSTAVTPLDGSVVLAADFTYTGKNYGGFIFNFSTGQNISAYQTLKFAIDASAMPYFANLSVKLENPGGPAPSVNLSDYSPAISNNWAVYEIPLVDFSALDLTDVVYLGFWNAREAGNQYQLTFGTLYFDDIYLAGGL